MTTTMELMSWALAQSTGTPASKLLLVMLASEAGSEATREASLPEMAHMIGGSVLRVERCLRRLERDGYIVRRPQIDGNEVIKLVLSK